MLFDVILLNLYLNYQHSFSTTSCRHYYTNTFDALTKIIRAEGFRVLWSCLTPILCVSTPTVIIYFTSYMKAKQLLDYNERSPNPILPVIVGIYQITGRLYRLIVLGPYSRMVAVIIVSLFELIRTKLQLEKLSYQ